MPKIQSKYTQQQMNLAIHEVKFLGHSVKGAARRNNVPPSTLRNRFRGSRSAKEAHEACQRLSAVEERLIVSWFVLQDTFGMTPTKTQITELAVKFLQERGDPEPLGGLTVLSRDMSQSRESERGKGPRLPANPALVNNRPEPVSDSNKVNSNDVANGVNNNENSTSNGVANEVIVVDEDESESESSDEMDTNEVDNEKTPEQMNSLRSPLGSRSNSQQRDSVDSAAPTPDDPITTRR
ncbi:hypothetical protein FPSE_11401 [Fusarium pseudograminearum CS3096]|uniref:HTH psq-type domain-containing protein n=1 Tax=Fusarium pseudograminearum (strain CS3096) TaxID=1028729 RepID=K3V8X6_FUSPC|nr:hypothetical protein FPSE_11401 [Fusarium pseudograminearum CS3096]EKJ68393.1 hypothetical protein FPSE_11401 [Fusarium pseudograminearum CS3096]KAF0644727.1 hypothetical protein FPSE5266_11401 [Fusarium pseudograminearum]